MHMSQPVAICSGGNPRMGHNPLCSVESTACPELANTGREASGTTAERQFDALLRLTNLVNRADAGILSSFALTLDDADQRTQVIREDGKVYTYGYDAIGQLTNASATLPDGTPWSGYQFSYSYDATGNPVEQNKNGLVYSNSFNNLNQNAETRFAGALAALGTYSSPLAATVTVNNVQAQLHDGDWAATGIPFVQGTNALARTIQDLAGRSSAVTSTVVVADRAYAYDANGNMTTNGVFTYVWDCENRLTEVWENGALVQSNRYDALWRRREKIEYAPDGTALTNRYIYKDWLVLAITDGGGNILETYTHGADLSGAVGGSAGGIGGILASTQAGGTAIYHCDFNGNIVNVSSSRQSLQASYTYSVFGEVLKKKGTFHSRYQFASKEYDAASGLNYYGYRLYASETGRWLSRDPLEEDGGENLFAFCGNEPVNKADFLGLDYLECLAACIEQNDPMNALIDSFIGRISAKLYIGAAGVPKSFLLWVAELKGDAELVKEVKRSIVMGKDLAYQPTKIILDWLQVNRGIAAKAGRLHGYVLIVYGNVLAAIEVDCAIHCICKDKYEGGNLFNTKQAIDFYAEKLFP